MKKILCVTMVILLYGGCACADVAINAANFPDEIFRNIVNGYDDNKDGTLSESEAKSVTGLYIYNKGITSLKGVEYFTALMDLWCFNNQITELDVSKNTALTTLFCHNNQLTALDVSKNTALTELSCFQNQITALDVSKNTALTELKCSYNQLTTLDLSKSTALTWLECYNNQLTVLDLSKNTALTYLNCEVNKITALDVSKNTKLETLGCGNNPLTALDLSKNTALTFLNCYKNQLTELDVSKNTALENLYCDNNQLTALDASKNTALTTLNCHSQNASPLKFSTTGDSSYPYQLAFTSYMTSAQIANVSDVKGLDSSGRNIAVIYAGGIAKFASKPASVKYNYETGYSTKKNGRNYYRRCSRRRYQARNHNSESSFWRNRHKLFSDSRGNRHNTNHVDNLSGESSYRTHTQQQRNDFGDSFDGRDVHIHGEGSKLCRQ